jgi:hypothetical protein
MRGNQLPYIKDVFGSEHPAAVLQLRHLTAV